MWPFQPSRIYLDHASATPVCPEASGAYARALSASGNPGALHTEGLAAREMLDGARSDIAAAFSVKARQIVFTSGSTEGNNLCILGLARELLISRGSLAQTHWIVSSIEHPSVIEAFGEVERLGGSVTFLDPQPDGRFLPEKICAAMRDDTVLVSIGWGNHEIGVLQPLRDISLALHAWADEKSLQPALLHSDLGQAVLYKVPQLHTLGLDFAVVGSGKLYGPRGAGAVFVSNRARVRGVTFGGDQERGLRAGTESPALACGLAAALVGAAERRETEAARLRVLRDALSAGLVSAIPGLTVNTPLRHSLPHILNVSVPGIDPEYTVLALDKVGIALSTKSACNAGEKSSHVVSALGGTAERAETTLRFSLGRDTRARDIPRVVATVIRIVSG